MNILFCDNHLLIMAKPAGLLTQPNESGEDSLEAQGKRYVKERFAKPGNVFLEAVHRLDKPVSGIVLFARTSKALSRLQKSQREGAFEKKYHALVEGTVTKGEWIDYLRHDDFRAVIDPAGKRCCLHYEALETDKETTLVEITLLTGRYHQIRAQCAHHGHPIVGDVKYDSKRKSSRLMLHHAHLTFPHPISGEALSLPSRGGGGL